MHDVGLHVCAEKVYGTSVCLFSKNCCTQPQAAGVENGGKGRMTISNTKLTRSCSMKLYNIY